jgi:thiamine biosynthesis lipoprotein
MTTDSTRRRLVLATGGLPWLAAAAPPLVRGEQRSAAFGTEIRVVALAASASAADAACAAALRAVHRTEALVDLVRPGAPLVELNRHQRVEADDPWLRAMAQTATWMHQASGGAFDVTVQPLWTLHAALARRGALPSAGDLRTVREHVDGRRLVLEAGQIRLEPPALAVTFNGLAQGFAADRAADALLAQGAQAGFVDAGELRTAGDPQPWTVALRADPFSGPRAEVARAMPAGALAVSSASGYIFSASERRHHIFDPRTGRSPQQLAHVVVHGAKAVDADAWSTAILAGGSALAVEALARGWIGGCRWRDFDGRGSSIGTLAAWVA